MNVADHYTSQRDPYAVSVGKRLAQTRAAMGYTQAEFARRLQITPQKLAHYERGANLLPPATVLRIFSLTRINSDWLYLNDPSRLPADLFEAIFGATAQSSVRRGA